MIHFFSILRAGGWIEFLIRNILVHGEIMKIMHWALLFCLNFECYSIVLVHVFLFNIVKNPELKIFGFVKFIVCMDERKG